MEPGPARALPFNQVILAGYPLYTKVYLELMQTMGVQVHGIVADAFPETPSVRAWSFEEYLQQKQWHNIPLVIHGFPIEEEKGHFFFFMDRLLERMPSPPPIYHAGCEAPFFPGSCANRIVRLGYPGSGYMLLHALTGAILAEKIPPFEVQPLQYIMTVIGTFYDISLADCVQRLLMGIAVEDYAVASHLTYLPGTMHVRVLLSGGRFLVINNLPDIGFLGRNLSGHILWTNSLLRLISVLGYSRKFLSMRNPFDIIASNAAKTYRPLTRALYDPDWFRLESRRLARYLQCALDHREAYITVRYEDVLSDPDGTLRAMAAELGVNLADDSLRQIWDKTGFKSLTPAGAEHLFRPGQSKLKYFTAGMIRTMEADGHRELALAFGYEWPGADAAPCDPLPHDDEPWKTPSPIYGRVDRIHNQRWTHTPTGVIVISDDPGALALVRSRIETPWFNIFHQALGNLYEKDFPPDVDELFPG